MDLSLIELAIGAYRDMSWREFAGLNVPILEDFLTRFEAIVKVGDEADREILESMVRHEAAIVRWASMERDGNVDGSLAEVIAQLNYPLPAVS
jgi:predicted methyltransferase